MAEQGAEEDRLDSWKQIAAYLNKSERTVRRWQGSEGLPVHKHPHQQRGTVWAFRRELDVWLHEKVIRPEPKADSPARSVRSYSIGAGVCFAVILGLVLGHQAPDHAPIAVSATPLTTLPGAEYGASFAPDGRHFVFHWDSTDSARAGLYIKEVDGDKITPLVVSAGSPRSFNYSPAWSPDGRTIAFLRRTAENDTWLVLVAADGGPERKLIRISSASVLFFGNHCHVSWSRDSRWIFVPYASSEAERGIYRVSASTGAATPIIQRTSNYAPAVSPDGNWLAALRVEGLPLAFQELLLYKLNPDATAEGNPVSLYKGYSMSSGIAWMPDSKTVLFCNAETALFGPFDSSIYRIPAVIGARMTSMGGAACNTITVSPQGLMVYGNGSHSRSKMLHTSLPPREPVQEFVASSRYDSYPNFSPDGASLAFYSTRSGEPEIWVANRDGTGLRRITRNSQLRSGPAWSPDGTRIVYVSGRSLAISPVTQEESPTIIGTGDGVPQNPVWSADGQTIYYTLGSKLWRIGLDGAERQALNAAPSVLSLVESPDGRSLYVTRLGQRFTLCRVPKDGSSEQVVVEGLALASVAVTRKSVYFMRADRTLYSLPLSGGPIKRIGIVPEFGDAGTMQFENRFAVSPDDTTIFWTLTESHQVDLERLGQDSRETGR